ncbi:MAG: hypothetical protein ABI824_04710 [Acidobacteriota bacterium]
MRFTVTLLLAVGTLAQAAEIAPGAHVLLRMQNTISSRTAHTGDYVYLRTDTPVSVNGVIVVPMGSHVQGVVTEAKRAGRVKGTAELTIRLEVLTLPSGKQMKFTPRTASVESDQNGQRVVDNEGKVKQAGTKMQDFGRVAILAGSGAAIGASVGSRVYDGGSAGSIGKGIGIGSGAGATVGLASVLLSRGREVELRQGSTLDVVFDQAVAVE